MQDTILHWRFTKIREWFQLKAKIYMICYDIYFEDRKIKHIQALYWWVTDLTLRGKNVDLNHFKRDVLSDVSEESGINFEDIIDCNGDMSNPKYFSH